jgi:hypothetical protein
VSLSWYSCPVAVQLDTMHLISLHFAASGHFTNEWSFQIIIQQELPRYVTHFSILL